MKKAQVLVVVKWQCLMLDSNYVACRAVATGGISVYIPPKSVYLNFFMWLFCLLAMTS